MDNMKLGLLNSLLLSAVLIAPVAVNADDAFDANMEQYLKTEKGQEAISNALKSYAELLEKREKLAQCEKSNFEIGNSPVKGPADAKITIVEFSDFQCPYCKRGKDNMEQVMKMFPNDVKIVFKQLPLSFHSKAKPAAKAALAAGKQGKFWEMHDLFFDNQGQLGDQYFEDKAKELGLDIEKFKADMASPEIEAQIEAESKLAAESGISGTPGFFVNGVAVKGAYPPEHFKGIIEGCLEALKK